MGQRGATMAGVRFREILRLTWGGFNAGEIAGACGCARSTVQDYVERAKSTGLTSERIAVLCDSELLSILGKKVHREHRPGGPANSYRLRPGIINALAT